MQVVPDDPQLAVGGGRIAELAGDVRDPYPMLAGVRAGTPVLRVHFGTTPGSRRRSCYAVFVTATMYQHNISDSFSSSARQVCLPAA